MNKMMKKSLITTLVIAVVVGGLGYRYGFPQQKSFELTTAFAKVGNIEKVVLTNGVLYPSKLVSVGAQVSGQIEALNVDLGDDVKRGDLIAQIDNLAQHNALKEAQASLKSINAQYLAKKAQIKGALSEFKRQQKMLADGATSESEYEIAESTLAVYRAELEQLSAEKEKSLISVDSAKLDLGYTTISSPIDGTVIYVSVEEGQTVNNNQGTPSIIELAQLEVMTVKAQVSEADIMNVKAGQEAYFTVLGADQKRYQGVIRAIEPGPTLLSGDDSDLTIGDDEAIYYSALFDVENPAQALRIGMTAQVSIVQEQANNAVLIPSQVLVGKPGPHGTYRVAVKRGDKIEPREVRVGINNKVYAQILSGLTAGDEIVLSQSAGSSSSTSGFSVNGPDRLPRLGGKERGGPRPEKGVGL